MELLKKLCSVYAPSGNEVAMTELIIEYINEKRKSWKVQPEVFHGDGFQNCIVLIFGNPRTAVYAHIDSIGFTVRYDNQLVKIGSPRTENGYVLKSDAAPLGSEYILRVDKNQNLFVEQSV